MLSDFEIRFGEPHRLIQPGDILYESHEQGSKLSSAKKTDARRKLRAWYLEKKAAKDAAKAAMDVAVDEAT